MWADVFRAFAIAFIMIGVILTVPNFQHTTFEVLAMLSMLAVFFFVVLRLCAFVLWMFERLPEEETINRSL